jgi:hypothetical protein
LRETIPALPIPAAQYEGIIAAVRSLEQNERADALVGMTLAPS